MGKRAPRGYQLRLGGIAAWVGLPPTAPAAAYAGCATGAAATPRRLLPDGLFSSVLSTLVGICVVGAIRGKHATRGTDGRTTYAFSCLPAARTWLEEDHRQHMVEGPR